MSKLLSYFGVYVSPHPTLMDVFVASRWTLLENFAFFGFVFVAILPKIDSKNRNGSQLCQPDWLNSLITTEK